MEDYAPFGIYDFQTGLEDRREPWLSPLSAWEELENAFVFRGRVTKRAGRRHFGVLGTPITTDLADTATGTDVLTGPVIPGEKSPSTYAVTLSDDGGTGVWGVDFHIGLDTTSNGAIDPADGLFVQQMTDVNIGGSGTGRSYAFTNEGPLFWWYDTEDYLDEASNFAGYTWRDLFKPSKLESGKGSGILIHDPKREHPRPAGPALEVSWSGGAIGTGSFTIEQNSDIRDLDTQFQPLTDSKYINLADQHADLASGSLTFGELSTGLMFLTFTGDPGTVLISWHAISGILDYETGTIDWWQPQTPSGDVQVEYEYNKGNPVMGVRGFFTQDGSEYLIALDTEELWQWHITELRFYRQTDDEYASGTTFNGGDSDFFWFEVFETYACLTNGIDRVQKWDPAGATAANMGTTYNPDSGDYMETAKIILRDRNRLVYLNTIEPTTTEWKQRARWTPVNSIEYSGASAESEDDYADAPTEARIVTAIKIGDDIIVGMSLGTWWRLRYDGDPELPYSWERLLGEEGASARMAFFVMPEQAIAQGENSIVGIDGVSVRPVDYPVPDMVRDQWNFGAREYAFAHYSKENRVGLMTYVHRTKTLPQHVLAMHVDETRQQMSYSNYNFPFADDSANGLHCFGEYRQTTTLTHDTVDLPHDEIDFSYNDAAGVQGFPMILAGDRNSKIWHILNEFYDDDDENVAMRAKTKRLNPFITPQNSMQRCQLGYIAFQADASDSQEMTIRVYADFDDSPYLETTIDLSSADSNEKIYRRILTNRAAMYHTIEILVTNKAAFNLDSMWLYAKPASTVQEIG